MIRPEAIAQLRLLIGSARTPLVASTRDREVAPLHPGQAIDARVDQKSGSGYAVWLHGRSYEFQLPQGTRPGDWLRLVYVSDQPRPTFALLRIDRTAIRSDAKLSEAGRLLAMLQEVPTNAGAETSAQSPAAVFEAETPETPQAATRLRQALSMSGLFYESHQAQWVTGSRTITQLKQEPQGRLTPLELAGTDGPPTRALPNKSEAAAADAVSGDAPQPGSAPNGDPGKAVAESEIAPARPPAHPDTYPIIRQQLAALETGQVSWRGEVWPGQWMDWEVSGGPDPERPPPQTVSIWSTQLKLALPNLGEVLARIELGSRGMKLKLVTGSEEHTALLRTQAPALTERIVAAGIAVCGFEVSHDGAPA